MLFEVLLKVCNNKPFRFWISFPDSRAAVLRDQLLQKETLLKPFSPLFTASPELWVLACSFWEVDHRNWKRLLLVISREFIGRLKTHIILFCQFVCFRWDWVAKELSLLLSHLGAPWHCKTYIISFRLILFIRKRFDLFASHNQRCFPWEDSLCWAARQLIQQTDLKKKKFQFEQLNLSRKFKFYSPWGF